MEVLREWALSFCAAAVVTVILRLLIPKGGTKWIYNLLLSVFLLGALIAPFMRELPELRLELIAAAVPQNYDDMAEQLGKTVDNQAENAVRDSAEKIVLAELAKMGINPQLVAIHISVNKEKEIVTELSAEVTLPAEYSNNTALKRDLEMALGFHVSLVGLAKEDVNETAGAA